ncbi:hypothetical protein ABZ471_37045 [Streptomyces sp. NPDC005728]|uniref:hypothetical protein n=1 Tax=Streptomyces sp. NPDC005728 TaxID=3157054 RepID=UPI0033DE3581
MISTAAHEAGHAVAAFYAGIPATPLEIVVLPPCGTCEAPKARGRNQGVHLGIASAEDTLRMLAAGVQAELLWAEDLGPLTDAEQWAIEVGGLDDQGHARAVAESLRDYGWPLLDYGPPGPDPQPWNWPHQCNRARAAARLWRPQVEILSNRLVQDRRLAAADITALLNNF